jgi:hypothetical protein
MGHEPAKYLSIYLYIYYCYNYTYYIFYISLIYIYISIYIYILGCVVASSCQLQPRKNSRSCCVEVSPRRKRRVVCSDVPWKTNGSTLGAPRSHRFLVFLEAIFVTYNERDYSDISIYILYQ